jgi:MFS family permease
MSLPLILTPFRFRNFRLWSGANVISTTGSWMQVLAANWLLLTATGSAAQMGLGILVSTLPVLLLGPWAGALADRLPARPMLSATQLVHALLSVILALVAASDANPAIWVYATMLTAGVINSIEGPMLGRFGSTLVDRDHLGPALAAGSLIGSGARVVGMSLGGTLIAATGPSLLFLINAASFLVVIGVMYLLRPLDPTAVDPLAHPEADKEAPAEPVPTTTWAGLRYVLTDRYVLITLGLAFLLGSLGRNYQVTMAAMSEGPLAAGAKGYGLLSTVFAIGATAGGLFAARAGRMYGRHLVLLGVGMSVLQAASGMAPGLWAFAAAMLPIAAAAVVVDTVVTTRMQLDNPLAVRGRVLAVVSAVSALAGATGAPVLGWMADLLGARGALISAGVITTLGTLAAGAGYLILRRRSAPATATPVPVAA